MGKEIKVSVFCVCYNHEKFIRTALEGFVMQKTDFPFEVFVHDDASTDSSADIIREYAQKYPDIIKPVYQSQNQYSKKIPIIRTFLVPKATGKYFAFCEGDDCWTDPNKLQLQVDFLDSHPDYAACVHNTEIFDVSHNCYTGLVSSYTQDRDIAFKEAVMWSGGQKYQTSSLMYRREYFFDRPDYFQIAKDFGDYPLAIYLTSASKMHFIAKTMSLYRLNSSAISWSSCNEGNAKKRAQHLACVIKMLNAVKETVSDDKKADVDKSIVLREYQLYISLGDYKNIKQPPFQKYFQKESKSFRFKFILRYYFPFVSTVRRYLKTVFKK
ncbi:MAG: glycosyltransferase family 2 protein [Clostridia bacterium]|nr:glycosyltransferase family 2 protein [Clostridia bacterium]